MFMTHENITSGNVDTITSNGIATITFSHPASNSLPGMLLRKLADKIREAGDDELVRVIVLKSAGEKAFCAGASFDELVSISNMEEGKRFFSGFANVINTMRKVPKLIIGRVQGKTVGGGVGLASAVDYCFATETASIKLSELAIGIGPFVVGPAVERKTGLAAMSQLAIDATSWQSARWAESKGLFNAVFPNTADMDNEVDTLAAKLAASSPEAMAALKKTFWTGTDHWDELLSERAAISGELVLSTFTRDAIASFKMGNR